MIARLLSAAAAAILLTATTAAGQSAFNTSNAPETAIKTDAGPVSEDEWRAAVRDALMIGWAGLYNEISYGFPDDYAAFEDDLVRRLQAGTLAEDDMAGLAYDFYGGVKVDYDNGLLSAPTRLMAQRAQATALMYQAVSNSIDACGELITQNHLTPSTLQTLSDEQLRAYEAYSTARTRALVAGIETPVQHPASTDADGEALDRAFVAVGGKPKLMDRMMSETGGDLTKAEVCQVITSYWKAVATLPNDAIARIMAGQ